MNLTDGLDGLAISVTFIAMSALTGFTYLSSDARWANYLELTHRPEAAELTVFCGAMAGASLGFLWYNAPPAQVFMGDVGSLAIGGAMGTVAVLTKQEFMLLMVGGVFVIEAVVGDAAGECLQDDETHDGHGAASIQDDAVASSLRDAGLEGVEDRLPVFDFGDPVCVVESLDVETGKQGAAGVGGQPALSALLSGKKVLIIGAARSGIAAARFLLAQGAVVALTDQKPIEKWTPGSFSAERLGRGFVAGRSRRVGCSINSIWSSSVREFRRTSFRFVTPSVRARKSSAKLNSLLVI